ncbi:DUF2625 family protein, partial [Escherichia coli]|uniref:DUF2625 family protein n=1 Tax=Escherichia coli TaxID=562 RepID=UPI001260C9C9
RNRSHWSTSKTPSYTKSVSWQHHPGCVYYFAPDTLNWESLEVGKRLARTVLIFTESSDQLSRATDRVP